MSFRATQTFPGKARKTTQKKNIEKLTEEGNVEEKKA